MPGIDPQRVRGQGRTHGGGVGEEYRDGFLPRRGIEVCPRTNTLSSVTGPQGGLGILPVLLVGRGRAQGEFRKSLLLQQQVVIHRPGVGLFGLVNFLGVLGHFPLQSRQPTRPQRPERTGLGGAVQVDHGCGSGHPGNLRGPRSDRRPRFSVRGLGAGFFGRIRFPCSPRIRAAVVRGTRLTHNVLLVVSRGPFSVSRSTARRVDEVCSSWT